MNLHICFFAPRAYPLLAGDDDIKVMGGAELQQVMLAQGLAQRGYKVTMICLDYGQGDDVNINGVHVIKAYRADQGVPIVRLIWPRLTGLWRSLREADADVYYTRAAGRGTGIVAMYCRKHGKKSLFSASSNPDFEKRTPKIRRTWDRWIYEFGLRNVDRIIVQNAEQARMCRENVKREATLIPNAMSSEPFTNREFARQVLWVSMFRKIKRPELFLELAATMPEYEFTMVGGAERRNHRWFESIKARSDELKNVTFAGFVPYSQVGKYFDDSAVLVNTSEHEGFPNTFLQAWARKIPTISFVDSGAQLEGTRVGYQVDSLAEMKEMVSRMMTDEPARLRMGELCRQYVEMHHSTDRVLDLYEKLLHELLVTKCKVE